MGKIVGKEKIYEQVRILDSNRCIRCGSYEGVQVHHIIPRSKCGKHTLDNLMCLCHNCHMGIHDGKVNMYELLNRLSRLKSFRWNEALGYYKVIYEKRKGYQL